MLTQQTDLPARLLRLPSDSLGSVVGCGRYSVTGLSEMSQSLPLKIEM
jgi:hypothetical protein